MKAVILAAGMGKRLAPSGWDAPKCLLPFGEWTILGHMLRGVMACGIRQAVVVVGYQQARVRQAVSEWNIAAEFVVNNAYAETNTIHSLYLAREHLDDDFVYFNGDVLFDHRILPDLLVGDDGRLAVDVKGCGAEEVKVIAEADGRITHIGKDLPGDRCLGEFIGVGRFAQTACKDFAAALVRHNEQLGHEGLFFESAVHDILGGHPHWAVDTGDRPAVEIDTPEDLDVARGLWDAGRIETL